MDTLVEQIVLQLPNFLGLVLALMLLMRQNQALTESLIRLSEKALDRVLEENAEAQSILVPPPPVVPSVERQVILRE